MTIIARSPAPAIPPETTEQYGVLYSDISRAVYPALVTDTGPTEKGARAAGEAQARMCPGTSWVLMCRASSTDRWREVGTGRSARQVLADLWHIRVDGGGW